MRPEMVTSPSDGGGPSLSPLPPHAASASTTQWITRKRQARVGKLKVILLEGPFRAYAMGADATTPHRLRKIAGCSARLSKLDRPLGDRSELLAQREHLILPVARLREPREGRRKRRIAPTPREPRGIVDHPQRSQAFNQAQLAGIEIGELTIALEDLGELLAHLASRPREEHPHVLDCRPHDAIVQVDEMRTRVRPQNVPAVAIAVQSQLRHAASRFERSANLLHEVRRHRFVRRLEMRRDPTFVEQVQAGVLSHSLDIQALAMPKLEPSTDHMDSPKEASHPLALRSRAELRPAPALAFEERETKLLVLEQRPSVVNDRRDDGHLRRGQLQGETVLLLDGGIAPSPGTIELRHER